MRGVTGLAVVALIALAGCMGGDDSGGSAESESAVQGSERLSLLFVQGARGGTLDIKAGTLTLTDASPTVTYFSNRPERLAGQMSLASLVKDWDRLYADDPPNAGIQTLGSGNGARAAVVELLEAPSYDAGGTVTYRVRAIDGPESAPDRVSLREVSLFIDGGLASGDAFGSGAVGNHCNPGDPSHCTFTAGADGDGCTPIDPRCGAASGAADCKRTPYDPCGVVLTVDRSGSGSGSVKSSPDGIDCPSICSNTFEYDGSGAQVTLTASPASGSTFEGWSGGGCSGTSPCTQTFGSNTTVTATFSNAGSSKGDALNCEEDPLECEDLLVIIKQGDGSGTVTSSPAGIDCGSECQYKFNPNERVTLSAEAAPGSTFEGWSGDSCSGTGPCAMTIDEGTGALTATFGGG
jgi:hypothetical protein